MISQGGSAISRKGLNGQNLQLFTSLLRAGLFFRKDRHCDDSKYNYYYFYYSSPYFFDSLCPEIITSAKRIPSSSEETITEIS